MPGCSDQAGWRHSFTPSGGLLDPIVTYVSGTGSCATTGNLADPDPGAIDQLEGDPGGWDTAFGWGQAAGLCAEQQPGRIAQHAGQAPLNPSPQL